LTLDTRRQNYWRWTCSVYVYIYACVRACVKSDKNFLLRYTHARRMRHLICIPRTTCKLYVLRKIVIYESYCLCIYILYWFS